MISRQINEDNFNVSQFPIEKKINRMCYFEITIHKLIFILLITGDIKDAWNSDNSKTTSVINFKDTLSIGITLKLQVNIVLQYDDRKIWYVGYLTRKTWLPSYENISMQLLFYCGL